jgi:bifunctional non-homologous end joining protein LigD
MSLTSYRQKRRFERTPEPKGTERRGRGPLRFVVQKHQASHLHYDFRLELDGVLKSWAVPKGPSMNPEDKRLALMVEDHPLDYRSFEGIIPPGNYGAGTVMVWDEGTYTPAKTAEGNDAEAALRRDLRGGHLHIQLHGQKLHGEFSLVKLHRGEKNAWLLVKKRDAFATKRDIRDEDRSVVSRRNLQEIAAGARAAGEVWLGKKQEGEVTLNDAPNGAMPRSVKPMLATLIDAPFNRAGWLFEPKWDGYRAIAEVNRRGVRLYSRNHKAFEDRYEPVVRSLEQLGHEAVLDGEVVVLDESGKPRFQLLQNYQKTGAGSLVYYVFDLLYLDGHDLRGLALGRRKELLAQIVRGLPQVRLSEHIEEQGIMFYEAASAQGLEGIIGKDSQSPYREGVRSREWVKIKTRLRQEAVIGGFTEPRGSRKRMGALVLGLYEGDELVYVGHSGGGFDSDTLATVHDKLVPLEQTACPFRKRPKTNAPVHWVRPELVCEVEFQEWTEDGHLRQPIFLGLREDKPARSVRRETPEAAPAADDARNGHTTREPLVAKKAVTPAVPEPVRNGREVTLTHPDKVYWPDEGYTKADVVNYYREVAPFILPYLRDRPESLHRHPNGYLGQSFFQKDVGKLHPPDWVHTVRVRSQSGSRLIRYLLCQDVDTLLYLANLGCIELNPLHSRVGSLDEPDYVVIDLDPEDTPFARVVETALEVRKLLDRAGAPCFCKTSGKRGLHIYVPLRARYDYDQAKQFAELIANLVNKRSPEFTSVLRSPSRRQHQVYLDFLQNRRGQTLAAPYSVRPAPGATVSTPVRWAEVRKSLDPSRFTIRTLPRRLARVGDLWQGVLGPGIDLADCLDRLARDA